MLESKVIHVLRTFSRSELGRWRDFVRSPYHNKNKYVIALAQFLEKRYPSFHPAKTTKERAFAFIFPQLKYNDLRLRHLLSLLLKVTEEFLAVQSTRQNRVNKNIGLMETFSKRNLSKHFETSGREVLQLQQNKKEQDVFHYYQQYRIYLQREWFLDQKDSRRKITGFQKVSDNLDAFYLINKLKQCCVMVNHHNVFGQQYELKLMDEVLNHLKTNKYDIPLLNLYHMGLLTLIEPQDEKHFFALKDSLEKNKGTIPKDEAAALHAIARNYSIKRLNTGNEKYVKELFDLYKLGLTSKVLLDDKGVILPGTYKNVIAVGLKLKDYKWTEKFIREYSKQLDEHYQKDFFNYNLAKLYFEKKEHNKVIEMLREVEFKDIFITVDARTLLIKTYYELDEFETLGSQLDSFRQFVARKKGLAYHSKNYLNTIRFTRQLMQLLPRDKKPAENLRKKIESEAMLTEKAWLLEKIKEAVR